MGIKMNKKFTLVILLLLIIELVFFQLKIPNLDFWLNIFRILSWLLFGTWYYLNQKPLNTRIKKLFFVSLLYAILISLFTYLLPERIAISINISIYVITLATWCYIFKLMGAKVLFKDNEYTFLRILPAYYILPLFFYILVLHNAVPKQYTLFILSYLFIFSYTGTLATFLPIKENNRLLISWSITLIILTNMINSYYTFLEKLPWAYLVNRTVTVISRCMLVYGMIKDYKIEKPGIADADPEP